MSTSTTRPRRRCASARSTRGRASSATWPRPPATPPLSTSEGGGPVACSTTRASRSRPHWGPTFTRSSSPPGPPNPTRWVSWRQPGARARARSPGPSSSSRASSTTPSPTSVRSRAVTGLTGRFCRWMPAACRCCPWFLATTRRRRGTVASRSPPWPSCPQRSAPFNRSLTVSRSRTGQAASSTATPPRPCRPWTSPLRASDWTS